MVDKQFIVMFPLHLRTTVTPEVLQSETRDVSDLLANYVKERKRMKVLELGAGTG